MANVAGFEQGDEVLADLSEHGFGGFAEYVCAPATALVLKPATVSFEAAAAVPTSAVAALQALRDAGRLQPGKHVLINGASGGVGTFAVQIAKYLGAEVTGVCSTGKMDVVRSAGADHVVDYTETDITTAGTRYDLVVDTAGSHTMRAYRSVLTREGTVRHGWRAHGTVPAGIALGVGVLGGRRPEIRREQSAGKP